MGNFGANNDTLCALTTTVVKIDSSYYLASDLCGIVAEGVMQQVAYLDGKLEVSMNVSNDELGKIGSAAITACSLGEITATLFASLDAGWDSLVFLPHSFEFLNDVRMRRNSVVRR